jgi:Protein of unknown function (DUF3617)
MMRQFVSLWLCAALVAAWGAQARAAELPLRKAGLWEMKLVRTGSPLPEMTMQHCTDANTDKDMATASSPMSKEICTRRDIEQTATGYVMDSVCSVAGVSMTTHSEITGDFSSAYTVKTTAHSDHAVAGLPKDATTTIEAKWLGACKADQKPGDIVMPGGFKLNVKDIEKLKGLVPK